MRIDLHTHSNASDGELTPDALVHLARDRGLGVIALTDHDSVAGLDAAITTGKQVGVQVVPGVELSADVEKAEVHVLGYFVDWHNARFLTMLEKFRDGRYGRAEKMVKKLTALGAPISFARVKDIAGDAALGRPHVAQALLEAGRVTTIAEAFDKYIGRNGPAYVERFKLTPEDAVSLILEAGGVPVLAHPRDVLYFVQPLVKAGLLGLEVHYGMYDDATRSELARQARQFDLIATGGSDFHGLNKMGHMSALGEVDVPANAVEKLKAKATSLQ
ncbi:MAG: PHP domain-containing protein [Chloroflexi bacterium]|nr:PHP domain-containing protein [Chloroflexota bacterium]